jgi:hypothetical protein
VIKLRKLALVALSLAALSAPKAWARGQFFGYAQKGGISVTTSNQVSLTKVQRSFPGATIKVCVANSSCSSGGGTVATLYSNVSGTAKANPFSAGSDGSFSFWTDTTSFDIVFYGPGITTSCGLTGQLPCTTAFTWTNQAFNGAASSNVAVNVTDFGAVCNGIADDTVFIQAAIDFLGGHQVLFPVGTCLATNTLTVSQSGVQLLGQGKGATIIKFQPTSGGKPAIKFSAGASTIGFNKIDGFSFISTNTTLQKFMIQLDDAEEVEISNIASVETGWTGATSEGVRSRGRQLLNLHDVVLAADLPIHLMQNPNAPGFDTDHYHLWNLYLIANNNPNIKVDTDVVVTNPDVDGYEAWNKGTDGIVYHPAGVTSSNSITIRNVRWEQQQGGAGYIVDIGSTAGILDLRLENLYGGLGCKGVRLRTIGYVTIDNLKYVGSSVALDIDATVQDTDIRGSYFGGTFGGASVSTTGQAIFTQDPANNTSSSPLPPNVRFRSTSISSAGMVLYGGSKFKTFTGQLANGGQFDLWGASGAGFNGAEKTAIILVSLQNNTTGASVAAGIINAAGGAGGSNTCPTASATFDQGNVPGKFTILWQSSVSNILLNQLGFTVNYTVQMIWN